MPPIEKDVPFDMGKPVLRHQHSASSDHGRALIPMWDSSDPERAPPPLPLNPQSPTVSRAGTSSAIQSAHAALTEKARENAALVPHIPKRIDPSPERQYLRNSTHRRMQSLQPGSVKDISLMLEGGRESPSSNPRSPEKVERPVTPSSSRSRDTFMEPKEFDSEENSKMGSPRPGPSLTPIIRPTVRRPQQSILGENTPPQSATMLALQNMNTSNNNTPIAKEHVAPLANITNGSTAVIKLPEVELLSNQLITLTNIATNLQKEMNQLSRRSRDNATDLLSLKEATNARDEDIRKSLRDLITNAREKSSTRDPYGGPLLLEGRPYHGPPSPTSLSKSATRPFSLPRIPSPNSFAASLDRESLLSTPSLVGGDSPATVALLEKILREMSTKDVQDTVLARLTELAEKVSRLAITEKLEELTRAIKANQQQAMIPAGGDHGGGGGGDSRSRGFNFEDDEDGASRRDLDFNRQSASSSHYGRLLPGHEIHPLSAPGSHAREVLNDEVLQAIQKVKDSVAQGGGLTAETKALVRELRGEVLGMGRELGRRLEEVSFKNSGDNDADGKAEMTKIIEEGLEEMKQQMTDLLRDHRRQSGGTISSRESSVDYKEIYNSMRAALKDSQANKPRVPELRREDVVQAVKDAWEKYKPEIEIQQIGLERDEVLACLQEGLRAHKPAASREEVFEAVVQGMKHYVPPQVETPATLSRDEILDAVRECLEEFEFPAPPGGDLSKDDMVDAVKEGLNSFDFPMPPPPAPRGPELTPHDVQDAVDKSLNAFDFSSIYSQALVPLSLSKADVTDAVKQALKTLDLSEDMLDAAREGVDSLDLPSSILRAVKEGLESFDFSAAYSSALVPRSEISRGDITDAVKEGLNSFHVPQSEISREDIADAVKEGLESFDVSDDMVHAVMKGLQSFNFTAVIPRPDLSRVDVVDAVKEGLDSLDLSGDLANVVRAELKAFDFSSQSTALVPATPTEDEVSQKLREMREFLQAEFRAVSEEAKQNVAASGRDTEQVLDATKDGFEKLRQDIESYVDRARGGTDQEEFTANLVRTLDGFRDEVAELVYKSTESSKEMLREEIESLRDTVNGSLVPALPQGGNHKEILEAMHEGLSSLRTEISTRPIAGLTDILDAVQEGLGDIKISIEKLHDKPADLTANDEILEALRDGLDGVRSDIDGLRDESKALTPVNDQALIPADNVLKQDDIKNLEALLAQIGVKVESMASTPPPPPVETLAKEDLAEMEEMLRNVNDSVSGISSKQPVESLEPVEDLIRNLQSSMEGMVDNLQKSIAEMAAREPPVPEPSNTDPASREDVQAIETILRNTKAALDELIEGEQAVRKDHIDVLETLLLETKGSLSDMTSRLDTLSSKEDVTTVESLVTQIVASFDEMKERHEKALEDPEKVTKTDVDAVEAVCLDIKTVIEQMMKADLASLPSKDDIHGLELLLKDVHDRMDSQTETNAKAMDDHQLEIVGVGERVSEVKTIFEEFQTIARSKLEDGARGIDAINGMLDAMGDTIRKNANISEDLKEMFDAMKVEFEDSRSTIVGAKLETDEKLQVTTDILTAKLDERIGELLAKYDEFQLSQEERAAKGEVRDAELEAAVVGTKAIAEELKVLIDTLGSTVTDSLEKMEEASKTVFERVEDLVNKTDEHQADGKAEHMLTREQVQEAIGKVDGLQGHVSEFQPKILETLNEVLLVVGEHFQHGKESAESIQLKIDQAPVPEKYDDSLVVEKLEKLVDHTYEADKAFAQLDTLDKVHATVKATAAELAAFLAAQTQRIADEHEDREKTLQETIIALERKLAEKEQIEANVTNLKDEEARLRESINVTLPEEQEKIKVQFLVNLQEEEARMREINAGLKEEQEQLKETFTAHLKEEEERLKEINASLKEEHDQLKETFIAGLKDEQARLMEMNVSLKEEQETLKETFITGLKEEQARLMETNVALKAEQELLKETFMANLKEEQARLLEENVALKTEQEALKETFMANLKEEQARLMEMNVQLKEEQEQLKETFLANLKEEEARLRQINDALREEQQAIRDTYLSNLREEESLLKEVNAGLREDQEKLRESFLATFKEEEERMKEVTAALREEQEQVRAAFREEELHLKEVNAGLREDQEKLRESFLAAFREEEERMKAATEALREEQEQLKATFRDDHERMKVELLANLMEEESRLKEANASLREEHEHIRADYLAAFKEEEERLKSCLADLRAEQDSLTRQRTRLSADLSALDTAIRLRREELHEMDARAEGLERRILESVMDHSRALLMANHKRAGRESMNRKRVSSTSTDNQGLGNSTNSGNITPKPATARNAINMALTSKKPLNSNAQGDAARRILSLTQITHNVPTGGVKRSQSVRTAVGGAGRKPSWIPGSTRRKGYGDLVGGSDREVDKENQLKESDEEGEIDDGFAGERAMSIHSVRPPSVRNPTPVDITVTSPDESQPIAGEDPEYLNHPDLAQFNEDRRREEELLGEFSEGELLDSEGSERRLSEDLENHDARSDTQTLRKASQGTTVVVTPGEEMYRGYEGEDSDRYSDISAGEEGRGHADEEPHDDNGSDWTASDDGRDSRLGTESEMTGTRTVSGSSLAAPVAA